MSIRSCRKVLVWNVGEKWTITTGKEKRSDGGEESKKKRCNQLSADQIIDIFRCSPLDHNITGVVKKVVVNARVVHLADFYGVGQSMVHDIFQMRGARVKVILSQNS